MKRVLSIDGGGMRGYIPAAALVELERRAGKPCCELFDLIAGTSIGGILAALLASGVSASDSLKFFTEDGPLIFKSSLWRSFGLFAPRYGADAIEAALVRRFDGRSSSDLKTKLLVTALDLTTGAPRFYENLFPDSQPFMLWRAARATSAAQTYFPAFVDVDGHVMWDGGNVANNPSVCAYADAVKLWGEDEPLRLLSLGCGQAPAPTFGPSLADAGLARVAAATVTMLFAAGQEDAHYQMEQFLGEDHLRVDLPMARELALDDASPDGLAALRLAGQQMTRLAAPAFDRLLA